MFLSVFVFVCLLMCVCGLFAVYCMMLAEWCLSGFFVLVLYVLCVVCVSVVCCVKSVCVLRLCIIVCRCIVCVLFVRLVHV